MNYPINAISHHYLGSSVYSTLREALISGRLKPNDRLRIRELAEQVGTSVTPVRDAILQLAKEQALEMRTPKTFACRSSAPCSMPRSAPCVLSLKDWGSPRGAENIRL